MSEPAKSKGLKGWSVEHGVMIRRGGHFLRSSWLSGPGIAWLTLFLLGPLAVIIWMSFMTKTPDGAIVAKVTIDNYARIGGKGPFGYDPSQFELIMRSLFVGFITTSTCLLGALPVAFFITALPKRLKSLALLLIVIPLWSNLLFRTYGWQLLLGDDSWFHRLLEVIGILDVTEHIYPSWKAMLLGMICTYLPFMIVPVYLSVEKIDWLQAQVARDLGASQIDAFKETILPQVQPGLIAGMVFVFLPAVGQFVVPDLLGGDRTYLLGNALEQEFAVTGDWPLGAAYCVVALCIVAVGLIIQTFFTRNRREREPIVL